LLIETRDVPPRSIADDWTAYTAAAAAASQPAAVATAAAAAARFAVRATPLDGPLRCAHDGVSMTFMITLACL
jgi:hypothetical protein